MGRGRNKTRATRGRARTIPVIAAFAHLARLARAGYVFAREGVLALIDPKPLPMPARTALWLARLLEKSSTGAARARLAEPGGARRVASGFSRTSMRLQRASLKVRCAPFWVIALSGIDALP